MKCEKCGNDYPSQFYFSTPTICNDCFAKLPAEEQHEYMKSNTGLLKMNEEAYRVRFGRRLGAYLLDLLVLSIVTLIVYNFTGFFSSYMQFINDVSSYAGNPEMMAELQKQFMDQNMTNFYFSNIFTIIYFLLEIMTGASIGKLILGIQIANDNHTRADYGKLTIRYMLKAGYAFIGLIWLASGVAALNTLVSIYTLAFVVGCFFVLGSQRKALHDKIAKTAVYYKQDIIEPTEEVELI